jgi:hypothetical protein
VKNEQIFCPETFAPYPLNEQLKDERSRLTLADQDYRKLKQELTSMKDDFHK